MNPETIKNSIQAVIDGLTPLAQQLQVPINKLFEWAIRENYVTAAMDIVWMIVAVIFFIVLYKVCKWGFKKDDSEYSSSNFYNNDGIAFTTTMVGVLGGIFFTIAFFLSLQDFAGRMINPEYHALQDIISKVK